METPLSGIGWVGLGRMGSVMATRLVESGSGLVVTNRTQSKAEPLGALGATVVARPADLVGCEVVMVMVAGDQDLVDVVTGPEGVLAAAPRVIVDCSTVSAPASARVREECATRGVAFLAAPVSGNPAVVAAGRATFAVSGPSEEFERVRPLLERLGCGVTYVGAGEAARLVKICHNVFLGIVAEALAETVVLAERGGISRHDYLAFLNDSVLGSAFTRYKSPALVNLDFTATFTAALLAKDLDLGLAAAREGGVAMPVTALCRELVAGAVGAGYGDDDFAVLLVEQARRTGLTLTSEEVAVDDGLGNPRA